MVDRVAALYDVHGNLPALEAVLAELEHERPEVVVFGGDVAAGPMPAETLERLIEFGDTARFVCGNADRGMVDAFDGRPVEPMRRVSEPLQRVAAWTASRISRGQRDFLAGFTQTVELELARLGPTLFCHGSPASDEEILTRRTPGPVVEEILRDVPQRTVVGGHTHVQYDRRIGSRRVLNAGSVGMPYQGEAGAFWLMFSPQPELRRTSYDFARAIGQIEATGFPEAADLIAESIADPVDPEQVIDMMERAAGRGAPS